MKIPLNEEGMRGKKDKKIFKERNQNWKGGRKEERGKKKERERKE